MKQTMLNGSPAKSMILFALPMIIGQIFQQVYSMVDSIIVGKFRGEESLAAVGASTVVCFVFLGIAIGLSIGCGVVISQFFGAGKISKMKTALFTAIISMLAISLILTLIGLFVAEPILRLLNTPENIFENALIFLKIYILGLFSIFLYNICNSIFNALGKSMITLVFLICSSILNVILSFFLVLKLGMGVNGVAWATFIAQTVAGISSFIALMIYIKKIGPEEKYKYFDKNLLPLMGKIAIPSMVQQTVVSVGFLFFQALINGYGVAVVAGYTAASRLDSMGIIPLLSVGNAVSTFTAQNMGAQKLDRIKKGFKAALMLSVGISLVITFVLLVFGKHLVGIFMDSGDSAQAINIGVQYIRTVGMFYVVCGLMNVTTSVLRGAGDINYSLLSVVMNFVLRIIAAYILAAIFVGSSAAIWWSTPFGWLIGFVVSYLRFRTGKWKLKSVVGKA